MKLTGLYSYGPIQPFDTIELPPFSVIIGPNGVGKSQLLQAISKGNVFVGEPPVRTSPTGEPFPMPPPGPNPGTVLITNFEGLPSFSTQNGSNTYPPGISSGFVASAKLSLTIDIIKSIAAKFGPAILEFTAQNRDPWVLGPEGLAAELGIAPNSDHMMEILNAFEEADKAISHHKFPHRPSSDPTLSILRTISLRTKIRPTLISQSMVSDYSAIGSFGIFNPDINNVFSYYRDKLSNNALSSMNGQDQLSNSEFEEKYGPSPWSLIDGLLRDFGLPYTVIQPTFGSPPPNYSLGFRHIVSREFVTPEAISSGEKVILRFVLAMLPYDPLRVSLQEPNLLLLDELDASLHPQMLYRWMETLREEFVAKRKIDCILTTHSPVTVALAPEDAIFEMSEGSPIPTRISKQQALNRLTVGLPTLSVDYSGQRQVFVESDTDASIFAMINTTLKKSLGLQRSLSFISTGFRNKRNEEQNAGCTVVKSVTQALRDSGNNSVFGLVDWDASRSSTSVIKVLAEGTHYTLENLLLDPLLVGALLLRDSDMQFPNGIVYPMLKDGNQELNQQIADFIQGKLEYPEGSSSDIQTVEYNGAPSVNIKKYLAVTPGHQIEVLLADKIPYLKRFAGNRGTMVKEVVDRILPHYPELCPRPIVDAFRSIANHDS